MLLASTSSEKAAAGNNNTKKRHLVLVSGYSTSILVMEICAGWHVNVLKFQKCAQTLTFQWKQWVKDEAVVTRPRIEFLKNQASD